ncbi:increased DNA methylation 1-like [Phaseolus vulgaris]|uniref:increased DNA methylation 1-like n=1 Tax=Phaseolus vulgaris TaxID=3885 RepID=UPI0035CC1531
MAMENADGRKNSKLKRSSEGIFQVNEEVEVRRVEEGFLGSWHPGIVIKCGIPKCYVRYKNVLNSDGSDYLVTVVRISKASECSRYSVRGFIRPPPPLIEFERFDLNYGLCVDVKCEEAWWEGVIFDEGDGLQKRSVFFPDLGDEMQIEIHQLRITQDWNETTRQWERRGNWKFLELVQEFQNGSFVAVSARQIWYDVLQKMKVGMRGEWAYNDKNLHKDVVRAIVKSYSGLTVNQLFSGLELPGSVVDGRPEQEFQPMNIDLNMTLFDKDNFMEKEPSPLVNQVLPEFEMQISHQVAPEVVSGESSERSESSANQKWRSSRDSKAKICRSQSNLEQGSLLPNFKPLNILSWLMDNKMVFPRSTVYYYNEEAWYHAASSWTRGKITRNGIKCYCCDIIYSFVGFEYHASGISTSTPSACIFLKDGKSLLECQIEIMQDLVTRETSELPCSNLLLDDNDLICSLCLFGGELILCDQCPSSFHMTCLGLEHIPDGHWLCPQCRCRSCRQSKLDENEEAHAALTCAQCEHKYHVWCLENGGLDLSRCSENWFCGKTCEKIHEGLFQLLGKPVSVGVDNLTWTLVKFIEPECDDLGRIKNDSSMAESYTKLNLALSVMHECFETLKQTLSSRDIIEDVIFARRSELKRLNFQGFYTVLLEKNEELVSVATVRVHGEKVAEVPFVGTRLHYRRHGFCRILMNGLEQFLMQLGVGRLVLPAVPSTLKTWTQSFGFAKMTDFERSTFMDYTFLNFEGSIMCHKLLMNNPPPYSESQPRCDYLPQSSVDLTNSISVSQGGMLYQQTGNTSTSNNNDRVTFAVPINMEKDISGDQQQYLNGSSSQFFHGSSSQFVHEKQDDEYNGEYTGKKVRFVHKGSF